ncbi:MAG: efflux RND transporter periplasmic adaptor subunit [Gemmataceae bacterium]
MSTNYKSLVMLAGLLALAGCGKSAKDSEETERLPRVEAVYPERLGSLSVRIEVSCVCDAMEKADLAARLPGVVESLQLNEELPPVDIGRSVRSGEPLVKLAVPDLEADRAAKEALLEQARQQDLLSQRARDVAQSDLDEARQAEKRNVAELKFRQIQLDRVRELAKREAVQPQLVQESELQMETAQAALEATKAAIATREAKLAAAQAELKVAQARINVAKADFQRLDALVNYATVRAPFDGVVTKRWVDRGAMIKDASAPLLTLMRVDVVRIVMDIPERNAALVNATEQNPNLDGKGDAVLLYFPSLRDTTSGGKYVGHITRKNAAVDPATRTLRTEIHLPNDGHLSPGMYGTATVLLDERYQVLTLPSTTLARRGSKTEVMYIEEPTGDPLQGKIRRKEVEVGLDDGLRVEIRRGLTGKELILAKGNAIFREGDKVSAVIDKPKP